MYLYTLDDWNGYDDGHVMLEVFMPDLKEWVLYDIGSKHYFTVNGLPTNALGLYHAAKTGDFEMVPISNTTMEDIVGFERYLFFMEEILTNPKAWYKRVVQSLLIGNNYFAQGDANDRKVIDDYYKGIPYYNEQQFRQKFYNPGDLIN